MNLLGAQDTDTSQAPSAPATDATAAAITTAAANATTTDAAAAIIALAVAMGGPFSSSSPSLPFKRLATSTFIS